MANITKRMVDKLKPGPKDVVIWDDHLKGFGVRVKPSGRKTFMVQYRNAGGRSRRITVGLYGRITTDEARKEARQLLAEAEKGLDPAETKSSSKTMPTMTKLAERYMAEYATVRKKPLSIAADERSLRLVILPHLGNRRVNEITRTDIVKLHQLFSSEPIKANRALALLSKMFNLAEKWGLRPDGSNPCRHVEKYQERKRDRFLSTDEISTLGTTLSEVEREGSELQSVLTAVRLLIFTGARLSEILTLKWEYVDLEFSVLRIPDSKTGPKMIPLNAPALEVIANAPKVKGNPYVCPGAKAGAHLVGIQKAWRRIRKKAGLNGVRLHDLRHTHASVGAAVGLGLPLIGAILGHSQTSTTQRYAHLATDPLIEAAEKIGKKIADSMNHDAEAHDK